MTGRKRICSNCYTVYSGKLDVCPACGTPWPEIHPEHQVNPYVRSVNPLYPVTQLLDYAGFFFCAWAVAPEQPLGMQWRVATFALGVLLVFSGHWLCLRYICKTTAEKRNLLSLARYVALGVSVWAVGWWVLWHWGLSPGNWLLLAMLAYIVVFSLMFKSWSEQSAEKAPLPGQVALQFVKYGIPVLAGGILAFAVSPKYLTAGFGVIGAAALALLLADRWHSEVSRTT